MGPDDRASAVGRQRTSGPVRNLSHPASEPVRSIEALFLWTADRFGSRKAVSVPTLQSSSVGTQTKHPRQEPRQGAHQIARIRCREPKREQSLTLPSARPIKVFICYQKRQARYRFLLARH